MASNSSSSSSNNIDPAELPHLRRCVELAREALEAGDAPFGSVLVDSAGRVLREDRNRTSTLGDATRHPEFELARWATQNMTVTDRQGATVYTSGEHCPMCAAAHAWVGLGRVAYVASAKQLDAWQREWGVAKNTVAALPVQDVAPPVKVAGPVPELEDEIKALHKKMAGRA